jgi:hypothetical protein
MSMVSSRPEIDTRLGFGRGSAVREYWLSRCQGFSVVSADGHHLGRVKRIETQVEGTLLRLTGLRGRIFPLSAIDTVWPSASLLVISDEHVDDRSEVSVGAERADTHPAWTEDTVPWWELVDGVRARQSERANGPYQRVRPRSARLTLDTPRIRTPAFSLKRAEPLAKWFAAWATNFVERSQEMGRTFARKLIRAKRATIRALGSARMTAHTAVLALTRRTRLRIARSLFRMGLWAYGSNAFALEARRDRRVEVDERDTEEIDLGSGWA